ncbi:MAG: hypothetical protein ACK4PI_14420 [Tepidisphaerales bacterium]
MLFSLLMLVLVAAIVFFHYVQGLFSSFLSAVIAAVAAVVAIGFHEQVVFWLAGGQLADIAHGAVMCGLFGAVYAGLRFAFDALVPGNVNFGVWPNRIGGAVMGLVAAFFGVGTLAVATQALPFSPSILGYSRWEVNENRVNLVGVPDWARVGRSGDIVDKLVMYDQLKDARLEPSRASGMLLPLDDFVIGFVSMVSSGSLAGDTPWSAVHPDYVNELFAQRLGLQPGAKRTAFPQDGQDQIEVLGLARLPETGVPQIDGELPEFRPPGATFEPVLRAEPGKTLVMVRVIVRNDATDSDNRVRFSLANFRLVAGGQNYYPVALLRGTRQAVHQRADDFLIMEGGKGVDLVFEVNPDHLVGPDVDIRSPEARVARGVFLEFKRLSRASLAGKEVLGPDDFETDPRTEASVLRRRGWPPEPKR